MLNSQPLSVITANGREKSRLRTKQRNKTILDPGLQKANKIITEMLTIPKLLDEY